MSLQLIDQEIDIHDAFSKKIKEMTKFFHSTPINIFMHCSMMPSDLGIHGTQKKSTKVADERYSFLQELNITAELLKYEGLPRVKR